MKFIGYLFVLLLGLSFSFRVSAALILTEVVETMMEAQANEALFIGQTFGVDNGSALHFVSNVDPLNRRFSYSTIPNQLYRGMGVSLSTSGSFDQILNKYNWTSSGTLGSQFWTSIGSVEWVGDPTGTVSTQIKFTANPSNSPITVLVEGKVQWEQGPVNAFSSGTYTYATLGGGNSWGPFNGTDRFDVMKQQWIHSVTVGKSNVTPDGINTFAAGILASSGDNKGTFEMRIQSVPEPSIFSLITIALFSMYTVAMRSRVKWRNRGQSTVFYESALPNAQGGVAQEFAQTT